MTTSGLVEADFRHIADLMDKILTSPTNDDVIRSVKSEVHEICKKYPLYDGADA
jgi:glycine hydroxymethyltransferase